MSLRSQRRMAAEILKVGESRVWIDPERIEDVELAISREEIRRLIHEKAIRKTPERSISRGRIRILREKRKKAWIIRIRAQRKKLRELRDKHIITESVYRRLYIMARSGAFRSVSSLERYIDTHNLRRRR